MNASANKDKSNNDDCPPNNPVTHRDRALAAFEHRETDRIPLFDQGVASDVASGILGREAFTGTVYLHYQEACAWMRGEDAHR